MNGMPVGAEALPNLGGIVWMGRAVCERSRVIEMQPIFTFSDFECAPMARHLPRKGLAQALDQKEG